MKKDVRVDNVISFHHFLSYLLDVLSLICSSIVLYFTLLYSVFGYTSFNYVGKQKEIDNTLVTYKLDYNYSNHEYNEFEEVIKEFYFDYYSDEILADYNSKYDPNNEKNLTITHVYNILVLGLSETPSVNKEDSYKNSFFEYYQNEDGSFNVNVIAKLKPGSGDNYDTGLKDIFYNSYSKLESYLYSFNADYSSLVDDINLYSFISRIIAFSICFIILYLVIPLASKNKNTLFEKVFSIARVNSKNGYLLKNYKVILRAFIYHLLSFIVAIFFSSYSFNILVIGYFLINTLLIFFGRNNRDLSDKILRLDPIDIKTSLIFKNKKEEKEYEDNNKEEYQDKEFLEKLKSIKYIFYSFYILIRGDSYEFKRQSCYCNWWFKRNWICYS